MNDNSNICTILHPELMTIIFANLSPKTLCKCRFVCSIWKNIIDYVTKNEKLWRNHCKTYYPCVSKEAYHKAIGKLSWYQLYRTLTLWSKLTDAREIISTFAHVEEEDIIKGFQVLSDGIIGVHKKNMIVYYDLNTLQESSFSPIFGTYLLYKENCNIIVKQKEDEQIIITRKENNKSTTNTVITSEKVKNVLLVAKSVFYITYGSDICCCKVTDGKFTTIKLKHLPGARTLGFANNQLHVYTSNRKVYITKSKANVGHFSVEKRINMRKALKSLEHTFQFNTHDDSYNDNQGLRHRMKYFAYERVIVAVPTIAHLCIYYSKETDSLTDFQNLRLMKNFYFEEQDEQGPANTVFDIDVVEGLDSHYIIYGTPKNMFSIQFIH